jgi:hypothetical protein
MTELAELDRLGNQLAKALEELDRLTSINAIRDCIYNVSRGTDRIDGDLLQSAFHDDAVVHFGHIYEGLVHGWIESTLAHQATQSQRQHLVGNIIVRVDGHTASAESYGIDRHKTPMNGEVLDLVMATRTLDRFERRNGEWRIAERTKVMDWARAISADEGLYDHSPLKRGGDDRSDPSYDLLP